MLLFFRTQKSLFRKLETLHNSSIYKIYNRFLSEYKFAQQLAIEGKRQDILYDWKDIKAKLQTSLSTQKSNNNVIESWIEYSIQTCIDEDKIENDHLILQDFLDHFTRESFVNEISNEELFKCLNALILWPSFTHPTIPKVPSQRESLIYEIKNAFEKLSRIKCFKDKNLRNKDIMNLNRSDFVHLASFWSLLQWKVSKSLSSSIIQKIGSESSGRSKALFRKISSKDFVRLIEILGRLDKIPSDFHVFYLYYKFYDLFESFTPNEILHITETLYYQKINVVESNDLVINLRKKIFGFAIKNASSLSLEALGKLSRTSLSYLYFQESTNYFLEFQKELLQKNIQSSSATPLIDILSMGHFEKTLYNPLLLESFFSVIIKDSSLFNLSCCYTLVQFLRNDIIPEKYRKTIVERIHNILIIRLQSSESNGYQSTFKFAGIILHLLLTNQFDSRVLSLFFDSHHFFTLSKNGKRELKDKFCYQDRNVKRSTGIIIRIIDGIIATDFPNYKGPLVHDRERLRLLYHGGYTLTKYLNNSDYELSERKTKFASLALNIKETLIECFGREAVIETMILPHFEITNFVLRIDPHTQKSLSIPIEFKNYTRGAIKVPTEKQNTWISLSIIDVSKANPVSLCLGTSNNTNNVYEKTLRHLGFNSIFISETAPIDKESLSRQILNNLKI